MCKIEALCLIIMFVMGPGRVRPETYGMQQAEHGHYPQLEIRPSWTPPSSAMLHIMLYIYIKEKEILSPQNGQIPNPISWKFVVLAM